MRSLRRIVTRRSLSRSLVISLLVVATLAVASIGWGKTIIGSSPANGATVSTSRPTFSFGVNGFQTDGSDSVFVRVSKSWYVSDGELSDPLVVGGLIQARPTAPGSTTFSAQEYVDLSPGVYYWQAEYYDIGCGYLVGGSGNFQPDCHPAAGTNCNGYTLKCVATVQQLTVSAATAPPPPPAPPPVPSPPPAPSPPSGGSNAPVVKALASAGRLGSVVRLKFRVNDESGRAAVTLGVFRTSGSLLGKKNYPMQALSSNVTYWGTWNAPARGRFKFCVVAKNPSGKVSKLSCAAVSVA